jgi:hypothetical protein
MNRAEKSVGGATNVECRSDVSQAPLVRRIYWFVSLMLRFRESSFWRQPGEVCGEGYGDAQGIHRHVFP